jgi:hypothetical protein
VHQIQTGVSHREKMQLILAGAHQPYNLKEPINALQASPKTSNLGPGKGFVQESDSFHSLRDPARKTQICRDRNFGACA